MTVQAVVPLKRFDGNGSTTQFSFTFTFDANDEIDVYKVDTTGLILLLTEVSQYTLTGAGTDAGWYRFQRSDY